MLCGVNPFKIKGTKQHERLQMVTGSEIKMHKIFSDDARSLLEGLLHRDVSFTSFITKLTSRHKDLGTTMWTKLKTTNFSEGSTGSRSKMGWSSRPSSQN